MKKIIIFGSTGMTGLCALDYAVKQGYQITAFVRDEKKIPDHVNGKIKVVIGNVTNYDQIEKAMVDQEGVVVVLGTRNDLKSTTELSDGMKNIIRAMKKNNVERVSVCLSAFLFRPPDNVPAAFVDLNADHQRMLDAIKESELKWIAVLPPHIAGLPNLNYTVKHDESPGLVISKHGLGEFLVDSLEQSEHYQKICGIAIDLTQFCSVS
ncbi:GSCOCG00006229001-RA-CDS [Cotesia congregata]|uniref:Similar to Blvrb: Flavin reductase (NADPH) (Mus musculus) n=1 Tax=Cotesia congregata TaxID=51543 RepID=A0A8J2HGL5_COTCN|nr:GSCOCG00006229001-RA-CDS [Cotesia congregata]CAG5093757.1 Similar to Blvrb: Flavin reductase (NADPH) (Mus musculus) [Cotesia congregata]